MRVFLIVNPVSGGHRSHPGRLSRRVDEARARLRRQGVAAEAALTTRAGHAAELAAAAVRDGVDVVAAWGGDGTVNEVSAALAGTTAALAIVPAGSGSGLARALGVPLRWQQAVELAARGVTRRIDLGRIATRTFANVAGLGLDAHVARAFNLARQAAPGRRGLGTYVRITVREFFRYRPVACRVCVGAERFDVGALLVALANSPQYGNGARIAPDARLDDGALDVVVVRAQSPLADLLRARRLFDGSIARDRAAVLRRAPSLSIEADAPLGFHTDGEPHQGGTRIEVETITSSLLVRVPPGSVS